MSDLIQMEMTLDEARETDRLIKRHINTTRYLLLNMRDRKGWKALGYESFKDYGEKSLGYEKAYLTQLADAGEISVQLGYDQEFAIANPIPPESQLRPLKAVPEDERKAVWDEATRKAEEEHAKLTAKRVEEAVAEWKQRNQEWAEQANQQRKAIRELETQIDLLKAQPAPEPVIKEVEKVPADYETAKQQAATLQAQTESLQKQLEAMQKQQAQLVNDQVRAKLRERQQELQKLEKDKELLESLIARNQSHLDSLSSEMRRITAHQEVINGVRLELIGLAAFLNDIESISDPDTIKKWLALASMCDEANKAIDMVFGQHGTGLRKAP